MHKKQCIVTGKKIICVLVYPGFKLISERTILANQNVILQTAEYFHCCSKNFCTVS